MHHDSVLLVLVWMVFLNFKCSNSSLSQNLNQFSNITDRISNKRILLSDAKRIYIEKNKVKLCCQHGSFVNMKFQILESCEHDEAAEMIETYNENGDQFNISFRNFDNLTSLCDEYFYVQIWQV